MRIVLLSHHHQPIGNHDRVVADATDRAYLPFLDLVERTAVPATVHVSGPLWEWWDEHRPEVADRYGAAPVEHLAGGWFEPVMAAIPENDRVEQLRLAQGELERRSGRRPTGAWLGERVWEPSLAGTLNRHDVAYTVLDGENLPPDRPTTRPYTVDYHGRTVAVFFIDHELRHAIPNRPVAEVVDLLIALAEADPEGVVVLGDDGEKFGLWDNGFSPQWLEALVAAVQQHPELEWSTLEDAYGAVESGGHLPLGTAMYSQMREWSGGYWPALVAREPASFAMWRRQVRLSRRLRRAPEEARRHLLRSQCNDAYWHGSFGGSQLPFLRAAVLEELIRARVIAGRRAAGGTDAEVVDWDADGTLELAVDLPGQAWVARADGRLWYLDDKEAEWAVTDAFADDLPLADRHESAHTPGYVLAGWDLAKGEATVTYTAEGVTKSITGRERLIEVQYEISDVPAGAFGPVLPVAMPEAAELRVDGGDPVAPIGTFEGHRFRLAAGDRHVLVSLPYPGRIVLVPLVSSHVDENAAEVEVHQGYEVWIAWTIGGPGTYRATIEIT